jgi:hypothetical protein
MRRLEGCLIDNGHFPFVELDTNIPFDPGKAFLLSDGDQNVIAG